MHDQVGWRKEPSHRMLVQPQPANN
jgi:hypothetical protein